MASSSGAGGSGGGGVYGGGVPGDHRKKWNVAEFEARARERLDNQALEAQVKEAQRRQAKGVRREDLKAREFKVDLDSRVGKSVVINKSTASADAGGYYCDVCDCVVKDSINFLDHINGKKHQKNMGMSMRVKRSTLDEVKARFETKLVEREQKKKEYDYQERVKDLQEEEQKLAEYRRQKKADLKKRKRPAPKDDDASGGMDPQMAAMMGFGGFGSKKK